MHKDVAYGIIPLKRLENSWQVFIIHRVKGFWEFPKGHAEEGEEPRRAAMRELKEETGLTALHFLEDTPIEQSYTHHDPGYPVQKRVVYYLAEVTGNPVLQKSEVKEGKWVTFDEAFIMLTHETSKNIARKASHLLRR